MRAAGIRQIGDAIELLELPAPRALRRPEVLLDVQACGVGNWDEFARTGGWDLGVRPPMALGVEAAGAAAAAGDRGGAVQVGDRVTVHSLPLCEQGAWGLPPEGLAVFQALAESIRRCQMAGVAGAGDDPHWLAAQVWAALHGLVLLRLNAPGFPWPGPLEQMADQAVARLIQLENPGTGSPPDPSKARRTAS